MPMWLFLPSYLACHPGGRLLRYLTWGKNIKKILSTWKNERWPGRYPVFIHLRGQMVSRLSRWKVYALVQGCVGMKYTD